MPPLTESGVQTTVTVIDATEQGCVGFSKGTYSVARMQRTIDLPVIRTNGSAGVLKCSYSTQHRDAIAGALRSPLGRSVSQACLQSR